MATKKQVVLIPIRVVIKRFIHIVTNLLTGAEIFYYSMALFIIVVLPSILAYYKGFSYGEDSIKSRLSQKSKENQELFAQLKKVKCKLRDTELSLDESTNDYYRLNDEYEGLMQDFKELKEEYDHFKKKHQTTDIGKRFS